MSSSRFTLTQTALRRKSCVLLLCGFRSDRKHRHPFTTSFRFRYISGVHLGCLLVIFRLTILCAIQSPLGYQCNAVYCICTFSGIACIQIKLHCADFFFFDFKTWFSRSKSICYYFVNLSVKCRCCFWETKYKPLPKLTHRNAPVSTF